MRIGVVADTHSPEFLERLPERLFELLAGVDLILHAGDVGGAATLRELARLAPVEAVRGDHDRGLDLPARRVLQLGGRTIALVHGNRSRLIEEPVTFVGTVTLGRFWPAPRIHLWLDRQFPDADVVVYGHTHAPAQVRNRGRLFFNPGAVYQVGQAEARRRLARHPNWFEWTWLQVIRHRRRVLPATIGMLEITPGAVEGRIIPL